MSNDPMEKQFAAGSLEHESIIQLVELYRITTAANMTNEEASPEELTHAMAAACVYAGTILGTLIAAGLAKDQDKKRFTDSMMRNFRSGIDVGKIKAERLMHEEYAGRA